MNWETIEHICISIAVIGAAVTYIIKGYKFAKKPADSVNAKLDRDNKRLIKLEDNFDYLSNAIDILMKADLAMLGHMSTDNNTGEMKAMEKEIQEFLIKN